MLGAFAAALVPVGIIGALAGSYLGARHFSVLWTRRLLGVVLLIAIVNFLVVNCEKVSIFLIEILPPSPLR